MHKHTHMHKIHHATDICNFFFFSLSDICKLFFLLDGRIFLYFQHSFLAG